ncbi:C2H2-type zinc finger protein [Aspergillus undulatus]|uniref:C2H2-type zinc finger protein n=1 Tax=Aspergillus undulatus TaxID=1810928 RepID=UPI003CCD7073
MTMVMENQNRQYGGGMGFDSVYQHPHHSQPPQFTDPWAHSSSHSTPVYPAPVGIKSDGESRPSHISLPYSVSVSAPSMVAPSTYSSAAPTTSYPAPDMMGSISHDIPRTTFEQTPAYTTAPSISSFAPTSYAPMSYASPVHQDSRRVSHADASRVAPSQPTSGPTFGDALDASRGMVALSQDLTPRNIYGPRSRGSGDSYGFPLAHSAGSSISSASYPYYSASVGSVESSVTDYSSTTSESYENGHLSRTLPRPSTLLTGSAPPGPQSMMSQFSSKMPSNTQKKHKCKVCDKRFTRPSSLQTHMYSHTGEKRKSPSKPSRIAVLSY